MAAHSFLELAERLVTEPLEKAELRDAMSRDDVAGWLGERGFGDLDPEDVSTAMAHVADAMPPRVAAELGGDASLEGLAEVDLAALGLDDLDDYRPIETADTTDLDELEESFGFEAAPPDTLDDEQLTDEVDEDQLGEDDDLDTNELDTNDLDTDELDSDELEDLAPAARVADDGTAEETGGPEGSLLDELRDGGALPDVPTLVEDALDESGLGEMPDPGDEAEQHQARDLDDIDAGLVELDEDRGDFWQDDDF
jgi:hypothetical protein